MCNMIKSDYWSIPGYPPLITYHPFPGLDDIELARAILHSELTWLSARFPAEDVERHVWHGGWS